MITFKQIPIYMYLFIADTRNSFHLILKRNIKYSFKRVNCLQKNGKIVFAFCLEKSTLCIFVFVSLQKVLYTHTLVAGIFSFLVKRIKAPPKGELRRVIMSRLGYSRPNCSFLHMLLPLLFNIAFHKHTCIMNDDACMIGHHS